MTINNTYSTQDHINKKNAKHNDANANANAKRNSIDSIHDNDTKAESFDENEQHHTNHDTYLQ
eukprot:6889862-Pyramimonas_sp.AAC.1